jgi:hypothetical protein
VEAGRDIGNDDNALSYPHGSDNTAEVSNIWVDRDIERKNGDIRFSTTQETTDKAVMGESIL